MASNNDSQDRMDYEYVTNLLDYTQNDINYIKSYIDLIDRDIRYINSYINNIAGQINPHERTNTTSNNPAGRINPVLPTHTPSYSRLFSRNLNTTYNFTNPSESSMPRYTNTPIYPPASTASTAYIPASTASTAYRPPASIPISIPPASTASSPPVSTASSPPVSRQPHISIPRPSTHYTYTPPTPPRQSPGPRIYTSAYNTTYGSSYRNPRTYNGNTFRLINNIFDNILNNDNIPTHMDISIYDIDNQRQRSNNETTDETEQQTHETPPNEETQQPGNLGNIFNLYSSIFNSNPIIRHDSVFNNTTVDIQIYDENTDEEDYDSCTICIDKIKNYDITRKNNKCNHVFHLNCSDRWFCEHISCPICRQDIRENINEDENNNNR